LLCVNKQMEDRSVFDGSCMDPSANEISPSLSLLNVIERVIIPSLYSHDAQFSFCAARCLLVVAPLFPTCTASFVFKAVSVLATLLRNTTSFSRARRILETLAPIVPRLSPVYIPRLCSLVVEAAASFPDRTDRMFLLETICYACVNQGSRPFRSPEVMAAFFDQPFMRPFYKDTNIRIADEFVVALVHVMTEAGYGESINETKEMEACLVFAEKTWHFLVCTVVDSLFAGDSWLRWVAKLLRTLFSDTEWLDSKNQKAVAALRDRASKMLGAIHMELPSVNNLTATIGLIYLLVCYTPVKSLNTIENCEPFYTVLRNRFMRMEDLEKWSTACSSARSSGLIISSQPRGSPYARPSPVLLQSVSRCLCMLCARSPQLAGPIDKLLQKFLSYYEDSVYVDEFCFEQQNMNHIIAPVIAATRRAVAAAASANNKNLCKTYPTSMHLVMNPVLTLEDDFLWLGVAASRARRSINDRCPVPEPTPELLVTGKSDIFAVTFSHVLNRELNRMTLFVKVTNATLFPQLGGSFTLETPQNMLPWSCENGFITKSRKEAISDLLSESIMKLDPVCSQTLSFSMQFTRFAPTRMIGRISVALSNGTPARESAPSTQGRIQSISYSDGPKASATTPRKQSEKRTEDASYTVDGSGLWPELFTEPYVLSPFELTDPLPMPAHVFDFVWARFPVSRKDIYVVQPTMSDTNAKLTNESFKAISHQILSKLEHQCNMYHVGEVEWGSERNFHSCYSFVSWFDDVFGVHVHGNHHPLENYFQVTLEFRSSSLAALTAITPALIQKSLFGDLDASLTATHTERPLSESTPYSANYPAQFSRWKSIKAAK